MKDLEIPPLVLYVQMLSDLFGGVGHELLMKAREKHPEYFQYDIEYGKRWTAIPQQKKDLYYGDGLPFSFPSEDQIKNIEKIVGPCPHPDIRGMGIIGTSNLMFSADPKERERLREYDDWNKNFYAEKAKIDTIRFNELFTEHGLKKLPNGDVELIGFVEIPPSQWPRKNTI